MIRKLLTILMSLLGVLVCVSLRRHEAGDAPPMLTAMQIAAIIIAGVIAILPFSASVERWLNRYRHPTPRGRALFAIGLSAVSILYLIFTAFAQHRALYPRFHDEHMYLLQMRLLSHFRLWTASPHNPDFFDSFHILVKPVYASIYFPGTALLYVWQIWLNAPQWLGPVLVAGAIIGLTFRVSAELLDDAVLGFLTALLVLGVLWFRYLSMVIMSHTVVPMLGLAMMWAYLHWRKNPSLIWMAIIGALAGWCAITRPVDAICYATPVAVAMLIHLARMNRQKMLTSIAVGVLCAAPLLSLQLILDKGVTGHFLETPYQLYTQLYSPNLAYGSRHYDPTAVAQTPVLQKQVYDANFNKIAAVAQVNNSALKSWFDWKFYQLMKLGLANTLLVVMLPITLLDLDRRGVCLLAGVLPIYMIGYAFFAFLLPHYCVVPSPAIAFFVVLAVDALRRAFPIVRGRLDVFFTLALAGLSICSLHEFTGRPDDHFVTPTMTAVALDLPRLVHPPAVVLFHYSGHEDYNQEPVYNVGALSIDDAPIIRAHDLGPERNPEIVDYYAHHQPDRMFYYFDRGTNKLERLGTARELAKQFPLSGSSSAISSPASAPTSSPASSPLSPPLSPAH
jgi:hypothetical protein